MKIIFLFFLASFIMVRSFSQNLVWAKQIGGVGNDKNFSIAVDASGYTYTVGYFTGTVDFDPGPGTFNLTSAGGEDVFICKLNTSGNFVWAKQIGGSSDDFARSVAVDVSGNIVITGSFNGVVDFDPGPGTFGLTSEGNWDVFICKLDGSGNFVWAERYGSSAEDYGNGIKTDASENIYITGSFKGTVDFDPGQGTYDLTAGYVDVFVLKLNSSGNLIWANKMGGPFTDSGNSIDVDAFGNVYITGNFLGTADFDPGPGIFDLNSNITGGSDADMFVSKLDASGNFVWAKQVSGTNNYYCYGYSIAVDNSGNVYTTGSFKETVDFDPGPATFNIAASGLDDGFALKLDSTGNFIWAKQVGGCQNEDYGNAILVDATGNVYISGVFQYIADFDPGPGIYDLHAAGGTDIYVCKLSDSGNFIWAIDMGGGSNDDGYSIALDALGNIYAVGDFEDWSDFDPGPGTTVFNTNGGYDAFVTKINQTVTAVTNVDWQNSQIDVYPNPIYQDQLKIRINDPTPPNLSIVDIQGREILMQKLQNGVNTVLLPRIEKGIYVLRFNDTRSYKTVSCKLVKL